MSAIADMVDFVVSGEYVKSKSTMQQTGMKLVLGLCYVLVAVGVVTMYDFCWRPSWTREFNGFSFVYFVGSCFQLLGVLALCLKMKAKKTGLGVSSQSLGLFAMSLSCRVFTTIIYDGYLPVDKSGDFWVQIVDACALLIVFYMLYLVNKTFVHSYEQEHDDFSIWPIVASCVTSACFIRADLNRDPLFDMLWAVGLNIEVFQMLPQLNMMNTAGGVVENTTAHYVVNIFIASACKLAFWIYATPRCPELTTESGLFQDMNVGGYYILGAHALCVLVMLDFMYFYVRAMWQGEKSVYLPKDGEVI